MQSREEKGKVEGFCFERHARSSVAQKGKQCQQSLVVCSSLFDFSSSSFLKPLWPWFFFLCATNIIYWLPKAIRWLLNVTGFYTMFEICLYFYVDIAFVVWRFNIVSTSTFFHHIMPLLVITYWKKEEYSPKPWFIASDRLQDMAQNRPFWCMEKVIEIFSPCWVI